MATKSSGVAPFVCAWRSARSPRATACSLIRSMVDTPSTDTNAKRLMRCRDTDACGCVAVARRYLPVRWRQAAESPQLAERTLRRRCSYADACLLQVESILVDEDTGLHSNGLGPIPLEIVRFRACVSLYFTLL